MKKYHKKRWLYHQYIEKKRGSPEIAKQVGCHSTTILTWLEKFDIPIRSKSEAIKTAKRKKFTKKKYSDKKWLYDQYMNKKKSTIEIASMMDCDPQTISNWLKKFNTPRRTISEANKSNKMVNRESLKELYVDNKMSFREIAEKLNCKVSTVKYWIYKYNIPTRNNSESNDIYYEKKKDRRYTNEEWLRDKYVNKFMSSRQIAEICNVEKSTILNWLHYFGIEIRKTHDTYIKRQLPQNFNYCGQCNTVKHESEFYPYLPHVCIECKHKKHCKHHRKLGYNTLNERFDGSVGHHIDDDTVIFIPEDLHLKCMYPDKDIHRSLVFNELVKEGKEEEIDLILSHYDKNWEQLCKK